jgi:hypothetical protein
MIDTNVSYAVWKTLVATKLATYYQDGPPLTIFSCSDSIRVWVSTENVEEIADFNVLYRAGATVVGSMDEATLRGALASQMPWRISRDADGSARFVDELRSDSRYTAITHNFADSCTWYQESTRVTEETLTTSDPERRIWSAVHAVWIDLSHGRLSDEDDVSSKYLPVITVDGVVQTEDESFGDGGDGDFAIDYGSGSVTFHESVPGGTDPVASYSYAGSSLFTLEPASGKVLRLLEAECQMSVDILMTDTIWYGIYVTIPGIGEILARQKKYKTIQDFINEANGAYPLIPSMGGEKRGTSHDTLTFPWHYVSRTDLKSSLKMKAKIRLLGDIPCEGFGAYVAFYCVSLTE